MKGLFPCKAFSRSSAPRRPFERVLYGQISPIAGIMALEDLLTRSHKILRRFSGHGETPSKSSVFKKKNLLKFFWSLEGLVVDLMPMKDFLKIFVPLKTS